MRRITPFAAIVVCTLAIGCGEAEPPTAAALDDASAAPAFVTGGGRQIVMLDACDPASFNEAFGFEVCTPPTGRAGIPFNTFIALLEKNQRVDAWRFAPDRIKIHRATTFALPNLGGIPHSFTEVAEFGGGFVDLLNVLSGNLDPAPECVHPTIPGAPHPDVDLIPGGGTGEITIEPGAGRKYMCCIHPWMRATTI